MIRNSPGENWESKHPSDLGMSAEKLGKAESWIQGKSTLKALKGKVVLIKFWGVW